MRKNFYILFVYLLHSLSGDGAFAQNIDSLKLALKNAKHDTTIIRISIELGESIYTSEQKTALSLWTNAMNLCEKHLASPTSLNASQKTFYLKRLADALNDIGYIYNNLGNIPKALDYYHKSLKLMEEIKNKEGIATSLNNIGFIYLNQGDIHKALDYFHKSLKNQQEINDNLGISSSLNSIGGIYVSQGDIPKALDYFHKSLKIREEMKDNQGIATSLNNIGQIYKDQGDIPKALEYFHKSLKIREEIKDKYGIATSLNNIGIIYKDQGDLPKALEYYHKSLKILEEINYKKGIAPSLNNIGVIYKDQGDITKALEYFQKSLMIREEIKDKLGIAISLNNIASAMLERKQMGRALEFASHSLETAKELGYPENINHAAATLKNIYKKQNNYKAAFEMYELEIQMRDSINNAETKKASIKKQFQYEYEKRAAADSVKNAEQQKVKNAALTAQRAQLKQERTQRFALYGGLVLVILFSAFVFNRFRITQRQKLTIEKQKQEVDLAYEKLHEKNKEVMDSIMYARRIQRALLTPEKYIERELNKLNNKN